MGRAKRKAERQAQQNGWRHVRTASDRAYFDMPAKKASRPGDDDVRPLLRDAITGEKLYTVPKLAIVVREERAERDRYTRQPNGERTPIPRAMDSAHPYPQGKLGGKRWYPEFATYIKSSVPEEVFIYHRNWREWWLDGYVLYRLREQMRPDRFNAIYRRLVNGEHPLVLARVLKHSTRWLDGCIREAEQIVRAKYYPYDMKPRESDPDPEDDDEARRELGETGTTPASA